VESVWGSSALAKRFQLSFYDANIVACALLAGAPVLLSEDMHSGLVIEGLVIQNPFKATGVFSSCTAMADVLV
jgi:predicted nucleic acid-binding protein